MHSRFSIESEYYFRDYNAKPSKYIDTEKKDAEKLGLSFKRKTAYKQWKKDDLYHRDGDEPAIIYHDGTKQWFQHGLLHRENDKPAIITKDGSKYWFKHGHLHRNNKPAIMLSNGFIEYFEEGKSYGNCMLSKSTISPDITDETKQHVQQLDDEIDSIQKQIDLLLKNDHDIISINEQPVQQADVHINEQPVQQANNEQPVQRVDVHINEQPTSTLQKISEVIDTVAECAVL
jgi:hypothetical protein